MCMNAKNAISWESGMRKPVEPKEETPTVSPSILFP